MMVPVEIFSVDNTSFETMALALFRYQSVSNPVYSKFVDLLGVDRDRVYSLGQVPFMPVSFFRNHKVVSGNTSAEVVFSSSGTTGNTTAYHHVLSKRLYEESFLRGFTRFYGDIADYVILALLPSYLEREGSSLVYMTDRLIRESGSGLSGFFLNNYDDLVALLPEVKSSGRKAILLGVTYALLHLARQYGPDLSDLIVMETGGMKGMHREMVREELHETLNNAFGTTVIHSEYGATELLSQAYSKGNGLFETPPWMRIMAGDINDPLSVTDDPGSSGTVNVIDLANFWSCSFLATSDLCRLHGNGAFEITGRYDNSDIRGCNLLAV